MSLFAPRQQTARIGSPSRRMFKGGFLAAAGNTLVVVADKTWTPAQVSVSSIGYRFNPAAGTLAPDADFAGGTIDRLLVLDDDKVQLFPAGLVRFPGLHEASGVLLRFPGAVAGELRILLEWDIDHYAAVYAGAYAAMVPRIGLPIEAGFVGYKP